MFSYCLKFRKNTEIKNHKVLRTKNGRITLLTKYAVCKSKKSKFLKDQEAWVLSNLTGIKITILSDLSILNAFLQKYKVNEIANMFLLARDKLMSEMHLKQSGFTCIPCGPFTKNKERIKKS